MDITFENPSVTQYPQASVYYFGSGSLSALNGKQVVGITVVAYSGVKQMPIFTCNSDVRDVDKTIYGWVTSNGAVATKIVARVAYK